MFSTQTRQNGKAHSVRPREDTAGTAAAHRAGSGSPERVQVPRCRMHKPEPLLPNRQPATVQCDRPRRPFKAVPASARKPASSGRPCWRHRLLWPPQSPYSQPERSQPGTEHNGRPSTGSSGAGT